MASYNDEDPGLTEDDYERIWAFDLPELVGREVAAPRPELLLPAVANTLAEVLGIECRLGAGYDGALQKYGIVDVTVPAPPFAPDGAPMVIQVYGPAVRLGDSAVGPGAGWFEHRRDPRTASLPITIRLQTAIYANLVHLGIGVPFYM